MQSVSAYISYARSFIIIFYHCNSSQSCPAQVILSGVISNHFFILTLPFTFLLSFFSPEQSESLVWLTLLSYPDIPTAHVHPAAFPPYLLQKNQCVQAWWWWFPSCDDSFPHCRHTRSRSSFLPFHNQKRYRKYNLHAHRDYSDPFHHRSQL